VPFELEYPGESGSRKITLQPTKDETNGFYRVGITPLGDPDWTVSVTPGGAAELSGLRDGDQVLEVLGALEGQTPNDALVSHFAEESPVELRVRRAGAAGEEELIETVRIEPRWDQAEDGRRVFGIEPPSHLVHAVRPSIATEALGLQAGDRMIEAAGKPILRSTDLVLALRDAPDLNLAVKVRRNDQVLTLHFPGFRKALAQGLIDDIAFEQDLDSTTILVRPKSAAFEAGLRTGDRIQALQDQKVLVWDDIQGLAATAAQQEQPLKFEVQRAGSTQPMAFSTTAALPIALDFGFGFRTGSYTFQTNGVTEAVMMGGRSSLNMLREAGMTLRQMFRQEISPKNMGGIVTISKVSYQASSMGWTKLLFFLCMLSVNLAFLNVLPIPLLDGGHLFFLMVEGLKGSPVSEKIMGYSQLVGLVLILSLMVYVTYQDILRLL
jgi:regulator of sigma E protease